MRSRPGPSWWQFQAYQAFELVLLASPASCRKNERYWINAGYWKNKTHGHGTQKSKHAGYWILEKNNAAWQKPCYIGDALYFSFSRLHKNTQKNTKQKKTTKKTNLSFGNKRLNSLQTKELSWTYEISSSDEWLCPTGAIAVLVDASEGAEDADGVRETLGKSKTGE